MIERKLLIVNINNRVSNSSEKVITMLCTPEISGRYTITVDYGLTVEEAVQAGGYDFAASYITSSNFFTAREGEHQLEAVIVRFDNVITYESWRMLARMDEKGLRAGELHELLAIGAQYPRKQKETGIVALGSSLWIRGHYRETQWQEGWVEGAQYYPTLTSYSGEKRDLLLVSDLGCGWWERTRSFLAVPK